MSEPTEPADAKPVGKATAFLVRVQGADFGPVYALDATKAASMGRASDNQIVVADEECSRFHAKLFPDADGWRVQDLGSTNGTYLNGKRLERPALLRAGDRVSIGEWRFVFATDLAKLPVDAPKTDLPLADGILVHLRRKRSTGKSSTNLKTARAVDAGVGELSKPAVQRMARCLLAMGMARDVAGFADAFLFALLEGTNSDGGAILEGHDAHAAVALAERALAGGAYALPHAQAFEAALKSGEAILADDIVRRKGSQIRRSTILTPIHDGDRIVGFAHLYSVDANRPLTSDDLDLVVSLAGRLGPALTECRRREALALEGEALRQAWTRESEIVGTSHALAAVVKKIAALANNNDPVLIQGELGTGKDLVARAIHQADAGRIGPFLVVRCGAGSEERVEAEIFGHEADAFASAYTMERGKAELARGGTLVLDEVAALSVSAQAKLLRALDGRGFERMGGAQSIRCDFRVIATTAKNLVQLVAEGKFRGDFHDRIAAQVLTLPPLRERPQDVPLLAQHFLRNYALEYGRKVENFSPGALLKLGKHNWPGNVRELRNAVERAALIAKGSTIETDDLSLGTKTAAGPAVAIYRPLPLDQVEADHILRTLRFTGWNVVKSAEILAIDRPTLEGYIDKYHLRREGA